ncbi:putative nuclease HARBI1 [Prorops nasuta]|uniref:putative nuclease HARBI1 n=1 Tax=Prorops nasuta TaxID=863751 RepID=UPI0034CD22D7
MATPNPFRCLSDRFGIGKGTAWRCVRKVVDALYEQVKNVIKWPTREEALKTSTYLHQKYGFPNTIGAIDGTHIKISAPQNHPETYINRKGYHSIQLQVICNEDLTFLHCYCGQIGSVHDMRVFRLSSFETLCTPQYFPEDTHLVGDAAYTIHQCIMVPFKDNGHLTEEEINFNNHLSSARMIVERSIGLLKGRFRSILDKLPMRRIDLIPKCIMACCILHNICILNSDLIDIPVVVESTPNNNEILNDSTSHDELKLREIYKLIQKCKLFIIYYLYITIM